MVDSSRQEDIRRRYLLDIVARADAKDNHTGPCSQPALATRKDPSMQMPIVRLHDHLVEPSSEVLGRAFFDDPMMTYILPEEEKRANRLSWLMGMGVRYGQQLGEVYTTQGEVLGTAVWLPPGKTDVEPEVMMQLGMAEGPTHLGEDAFERFLAFMGFCQPLHQQALSTAPHWYLMILGVDPFCQGQGIGGRLIQPVLQQADQQGLPCYLETAKERNLPFYRKHGFQVLVATQMPDGPRVWTMLRPAPQKKNPPQSR